jgi:predicted PurR-regulated permease PerM
MTSDGNNSSPNNKSRVSEVVEITIRLGLVLSLLILSFKIIAPFSSLVAWGAILAIMLYPLFLKMVAGMGGNRKRAGTVFILLSVVLIGVPSFMLAKGSVSTAREISTKLEAGQVHVPPPTEKVKEWPVIGDKAYAAWAKASTDFPAAMQQYQPELKALGGKALGFIAQTGKTLVFFLFSLILAGVFMINGESAAGFAAKLYDRLLGKEGASFLTLSVLTIRSVAKGVLGTAFIQMILAIIGLVAAGIPMAGVWAVIVLFLAIIQLPPIIILAPVFVWNFSVAEPIPATIFCVWCIFVSFADSFLKPILMGRGVEAPMLVILLGAIGGMILSGIIGLFVGAVILALVYTLFITWLNDGVVEKPVEEPVKKAAETVASEA